MGEQALALAAQEQHAPRGIAFHLVVGLAGMRRAAVDVISLTGGPGGKFSKSDLHQREPEQGPHAGAHRAGMVRVGAVLVVGGVVEQQQPVRADGLGAAQDAADVAGVLRGHQGHQPGAALGVQVGEGAARLADDGQQARRVILLSQAGENLFGHGVTGHRGGLLLLDELAGKLAAQQAGRVADIFQRRAGGAGLAHMADALGHEQAAGLAGFALLQEQADLLDLGVTGAGEGRHSY